MSPRSRGTNTRTDLLTPRLPAGTVEKDQSYGARTAQQQSMRVLPIGAPSTPPPVAPPASASAPGAPPPDLGRVLAGNQSGVMPGTLDWKNKPGDRPLTHGLPVGPGPGLEALGVAGDNIQQLSNESGSLGQLLTHLASQPNASSVVKALAGRAGTSI